jgi:hypothetical protein
MGEYNYFSAEAMAVATDAIRDQAKNWKNLSADMDGVRQTLAGFGLSLSAFAVTDLLAGSATVDLKAGYDQMHDFLNKLCTQAVHEFETFGNALNKAADWYEDSDANSVANLDQIYS